jgi:hypothetical protein
LLALRGELRELAVERAQSALQAVELGLDAVDLRAQRLFCYCDCGVH